MRKVDVEGVWEDCTVGFKCPVCGQLLVADSQNEELICDCGKIKYQLSCTLRLEGIRNEKENNATNDLCS